MLSQAERKAIPITASILAASWEASIDSVKAAANRGNSTHIRQKQIQLYQSSHFSLLSKFFEAVSPASALEWVHQQKK